jgi:predicted ribosome quality control (RQC) complex YloA/Tae2 family protein
MREERVASPSALVERFFGATARVQAHGQRKEALAGTIGQERERLVARERALLAEAARAEEAERWRRWGEAIYAYAWSLEPGQSELVADDLTVPLDPARTPSENAQEYFERYRKAQSAAANIPALLEETRHAIAYLDQLLTLLRLAEHFDQIAAIDREWQDWHAGRHRTQESEGDSAGRKRGGKGQGKSGAPRGRGSAPGRPQTLRTRGGHQIFIGHTSAQNDAVTFDIGGPDDVWLHSRGVPGSHVILKWAGGRADDAVLQAAAELAAYYSGGRESGRVEVDHAARRDVRKIRGAGPGMVTYRNERTMRVSPRGEEELRRLGVIE